MPSGPVERFCRLRRRLTVTDPDTGEAMFQAPAAAALAGVYGDFSFDPTSGAWSYALDPARANPLFAGQVVHDTLTVWSLDGTASQPIDVTNSDHVTVLGSNVAFVHTNVGIDPLPELHFEPED